MIQLKTLLLALTSVTISQMTWAQTATTPFQAQKVAHDLMRLNSGLLYGQNQKYADIFSRIGSRFEMTEVNPELVRRHEQTFARQSSYLNRTIKRSEPYLYHVAAEVERRNMPGEIALLPFIESAFVIKAKSPVGASGLWQFMPATGKQYGLEQNNVYDGRHDVHAATDAALNYLEYLYSLFGDWSLALAAYNWGEGNVSRAVKRAESQGLLPTYENLKMPQETRNYAPKLLAWRNIVSNPAAFGINIPNIEDDEYFKAVDISTPIDISQAARLAGISQEEFLRLNPGFNIPVFIPTAKRKMLLPKNAVNHFVRNYQAADVNQLLSYNLYTPHSGEKIQDVAASFGMSDAELKQLNGLRSNQLSAGVPVLVAKNRPALNPSEFNQYGNAIVGDFNLAQADALAKPKAQLAQATPLKVRGTRAVQIQSNIAMPQDSNKTRLLQGDVIGQTAIAAANKYTAGSTVNNALASATIEQAQPTITVVAAAPTASATVAQSVAADTLAVNNTATNKTSFIAAAELPATGLQDAANNTAAADPLLALMNTRPVHADAATGVNQDYAANAVRSAIARENAREAREQERVAKLRLDADKREQQLANASQHKVASGDTLYSIARSYEMSVADLLAANGLSNDTIKVGQTLKVGKAANLAIQLAQTKNKKQQPQTDYVVRKGDTLNSIAGKFNLKVNDLRKLNSTNSTIRPGQKIMLRQL